MDNLRIACRPCNKAKGNKTAAEYLEMKRRGSKRR